MVDREKHVVLKTHPGPCPAVGLDQAALKERGDEVNAEALSEPLIRDGHSAFRARMASPHASAVHREPESPSAKLADEAPPANLAAEAPPEEEFVALGKGYGDKNPKKGTDPATCRSGRPRRVRYAPRAHKRGLGAGQGSEDPPTGR